MSTRNNARLAAGWSLGLVAAVLAAVVLAGPAAADRRIALIIGNSAYLHAGVLKNAKNDAQTIKNTLSRLGFEVTVLIDANQHDMKKQMLEFGRALRVSADVGLFYYAGHAVQVGGSNYLVPIDAVLTDEAEIGIEAVNVNEFLGTMETAQSRVKIVVLDACRNNPFPAASRSGTRGLAIVQAPAGTLVAYSTSPGDVALDGEGNNSPYAIALANAFESEAGKSIELIFRKARTEVQAATGGKQLPWDLSSLTGDVVLSAAAAGSAGAANPSVASSSSSQGDTDASAEIAFWNSIAASSNPVMFEAYLGQYPNGRFVALANAKLGEIAAARDQQQANEIANQQQAEAERDVEAQQAEEARQAAAAEKLRKQKKAAALTQRAWLLPNSSRRALKAADLTDFSCGELWTARNEIFARRGYCFSTSRGREAFGNDGCTTSSQDILTPLEKRNVEFIQQFEQRQSCG